MIPLSIYKLIADQVTANLSGDTSFVSLDENINGTQYIIESEVECFAQTVNDSFSHEFGTHTDSHTEITGIADVVNGHCLVIKGECEHSEPVDWDIVERIVSRRFVNAEYARFCHQQRHQMFQLAQ